MNCDELLRERAIEPVTVAPQEIADLVRVARRDIATARNLVSTDLDWAFVIAYNSVLQLSIAYMNHLGYRPRGEGKHANTFRFMRKAFPEEQAIRRLQQIRRKRNRTVYERIGMVSEDEAGEIIVFAERYLDEILSRLPRELAQLAPGEVDE